MKAKRRISAVAVCADNADWFANNADNALGASIGVICETAFGVIGG